MASQLSILTVTYLLFFFFFTLKMDQECLGLLPWRAEHISNHSVNVGVCCPQVVTEGNATLGLNGSHRETHGSLCVSTNTNVSHIVKGDILHPF